jgi:hypothetical protein
MSSTAHDDPKTAKPEEAPKWGPRKWWVPGVALPVSQEMQDDIRANPDKVRIVVLRKDGTVRSERPKLSYPAKGTSDHGLIAGLIYWRGELTSRWFEPEEGR